MSNAKPCLKIIFPDFFDHVASYDPAEFEQTFPYLARLINRSRISEDAHQTITHEILGVFGWHCKNGRLPNLTALTAALDELQYTDSLYRADPIHLRADGVRLRLFGGKYFAPDQQEANALIRELNEQFPECEFQCGRDPSRWYVRFPAPLDFEAKTPLQMYQQVIDEELPTGSDAKQLHAKMNEFQMVMHQSKVNQDRELSGKPALNSVWVWGNGEPLPALSSPDLEIYGDDLLAQALAKRAAAACFPSPSSPKALVTSLNTGVKVLIFNAPNGSLCGGTQETDLQQLEQQWGGAVLTSLRQGRLKKLEIVDNYRRLTVGRLDVWKFWKRTSYFSDRLRVDIDPQKISADISPNDVIN